MSLRFESYTLLQHQVPVTSPGAPRPKGTDAYKYVEPEQGARSASYTAVQGVLAETADKTGTLDLFLDGSITKRAAAARNLSYCCVPMTISEKEDPVSVPNYAHLVSPPSLSELRVALNGLEGVRRQSLVEVHAHLYREDWYSVDPRGAMEGACILPAPQYLGLCTQELAGAFDTGSFPERPVRAGGEYVEGETTFGEEQVLLKHYPRLSTQECLYPIPADRMRPETEALTEMDSVTTSTRKRPRHAE